MFERSCQGTADCVKARLELIQVECFIIAAGLWLFVLIAVVILAVYLCCVTPPKPPKPKKPLKNEPQVWKPVVPVVDVPVTEPQQPAPSEGGDSEKAPSTAKADSEQREVIPPVVSVPPDAGGQEQPEDNPAVEEVPNTEQPEDAPAVEEVPNAEQPQQVPQEPGQSQHADQKEWGESVHLSPK